MDVALRGGNDFSTTSMCLVILLATWAGRPPPPPPRKAQSGQSPTNIVKARASTLLRSILKQFIQGEFEVLLHTALGSCCFAFCIIEGGAVVFDWHAFPDCDIGQRFRRAKLFREDEFVSVLDFLEVCAADDVSRNVSVARKEGARIMLGCVAFAVGLLVEASRGAEMWNKTPLAQMAQVTDARGYKRASPGYKQSAVQVCSEAKLLRHVSQFVAAKAVVHDGNLTLDPHNSIEYVKRERYSYLISNMQRSSWVISLSIVAGARSAFEHFLNSVVWNGDIRKVVVCPPQALGGSWWGSGRPPSTPPPPHTHPQSRAKRSLPFLG